VPLDAAAATADGKKAGSQRTTKKGASGRATGAATSTRLTRTRAAGVAPLEKRSPVGLYIGATLTCVVINVGVVMALQPDPPGPPTKTTDVANPTTDGGPPPTTTDGKQPPSTFTEAFPSAPGTDGAPPIPDKPPSTKHELDEASLNWMDYLKIKAGDLADKEQYDEAVRVLQTFPRVLREGAGFARVQEKLAEYSRFGGFKRKLEEALKAGSSSPELRELIQRVENNGAEPDLLKLPCVERFKEEARQLLGGTRYDEIALEPFDPQVFDTPDDQ
jgi:hypothetical protein